MKQKPLLAEHQSHIHQMIQSAVAAVDPCKCTQNSLRLDGTQLKTVGKKFNLEKGRLFLVAIGKAAVPMANGVIGSLGKLIEAGVAVTKKGQTEVVDHPKVQTLFAAHPVPDESSILAADAIFELLEQTAENDFVLFLISGGASALCTRPLLDMITWQTLSQDLLASGCTIQEFNTVRKQLDQVKGGGLAQAAFPAEIATLVLSDVIGNPIDMIGSGPTTPNPQTPSDALDILKKFNIKNGAAVEQLVFLEKGQILADFESPYEIVADLRIATAAAKEQALTFGYATKIVSTTLSGEACEVGRRAAAIGRELLPGTCAIFGGETTVTLKGDGIGGRNQELALAAAIALDGVDDVVVATYATDGDDGPTIAAGAIVTGQTVALGRKLGLDAKTYLANHDSYTYFDQLDGHLIITGQTGTNVNDLLFVIRY